MDACLLRYPPTNKFITCTSLGLSTLHCETTGAGVCPLLPFASSSGNRKRLHQVQVGAVVVKARNRSLRSSFLMSYSRGLCGWGHNPVTSNTNFSLLNPLYPGSGSPPSRSQLHTSDAGNNSMCAGCQNNPRNRPISLAAIDSLDLIGVTHTGGWLRVFSYQGSKTFSCSSCKTLRQMVSRKPFPATKVVIGVPRRPPLKPPPKLGEFDA